MKLFKKGAAVVLAAAVALGLAACGQTEDTSSSDVAASFGDIEIPLAEANFFLRYEQWMDEMYYGSYYTSYGYENMWEAESGEGDKTIGDVVKENVLASLKQMKILCAHAEDYEASLTEDETTQVSDTVTSLRSDLSETFWSYCDVTDDQLTEWVTENALSYAVYEAITAQADTTVTDEECKTFSISYFAISEDTTSETTAAEDTSEESDAAEESSEETAAEETSEAASESEVYTGETLADEILTRLQAGEDIYDVASALNVEDYYSSTSYLVTPTDDETAEETLYKEGVKLATGESVKVSDENGGWYVIYCSSDNDTEAAEENRTTLESEKAEDYFNEVYEGFAETSNELEVNDSWTNIELTMIYEDESSEEDTDTLTEETVADDTVTEETAADDAAAEETAADDASAEETAADDTQAAAE